MPIPEAGLVFTDVAVRSIMAMSMQVTFGRAGIGLWTGPNDILHPFMAPFVIGLLLGLVGTDVSSGAARYTFDLPILGDGLGFVPLAMGLFGIAQIIKTLLAPKSSAVSSPAASQACS